MAVIVYVNKTGRGMPSVMNVNCKVAVAYRTMVNNLRVEALHRGTEGKRGEFSCKPVDLETSAAKYEAIRNGGASPEASKEVKAKYVPKDLTVAEIRKRETFWQSGAVVFPRRNRGFKFSGAFATNHSMEKGLGIDDLEAGPPPANVPYTEPKIYCSFCQLEVDAATCTRSKTSKKVACDNCCLKIVNPKFMETPG